MRQSRAAFIGAAAALALAEVGGVPIINTEPERSAVNHHKPSWSKPVSGGGDRERQRMLARLEKAKATP